MVGGISSIMKNGINCIEISVMDAMDIKYKIVNIMQDSDMRIKCAMGGISTMEIVYRNSGTKHSKQVASRVKDEIG
jgi:hypothetical protein